MRDPQMPKKHTIPNTTTAKLTITLFVYGTLKRGFWNHDRFCQGAIDIQPATTWGRLYELPAGYPALEVPESHILAHGTSDPIADAQTQARLNATTHTFSRPTGDWDLIHGELLTFANPSQDLPPIDRLEGFYVGGTSLYRRVLICIWDDAKHCLAWVYSASYPLAGISLDCAQWS